MTYSKTLIARFLLGLIFIVSFQGISASSGRANHAIREGNHQSQEINSSDHCSITDPRCSYQE